jgi:hypothetical protein
MLPFSALFTVDSLPLHQMLLLPSKCQKLVTKTAKTLANVLAIFTESFDNLNEPLNLQLVGRTGMVYTWITLPRTNRLKCQQLSWGDVKTYKINPIGVLLPKKARARPGTVTVPDVFVCIVAPKPLPMYLNNVCREIGYLFHMKARNDVVQGAGYLSQNDITWGQANCTGMPPDQKMNKAEELTHLFTNILPK